MKTTGWRRLDSRCLQRAASATGIALFAAAAAAANWQGVQVDSGRRMEVDRASIRSAEPGKVQAWARVLFDKPVADTVSGGSYRVIEALNRYDCTARSVATLKRIYRKDESEALREEESKAPADLPVRSGTVDEKILKIACRPGAVAGARQDFRKAVQDANAAAEQLRQANAAVVRKEAGKKELLKADLARQGEARASPTVVARPVRRLGGQRPARRLPRVEDAPLDWSYAGAAGPENWARLAPANHACGGGIRQSPVDLRDGLRVDPPAVDFRYVAAPFAILDSGRGIEVTTAAGGMHLLGREYRFARLVFHRPAEHQVEGRTAVIEAQLEHRSADGRLAVLAVLFEIGGEHPLIQTLWNHLPLEAGEPVAPPEPSLDLNELLPAERGYYTYMGSLTHPPCSEGVVWIVMKQPVAMSAEQAAILARLYPNNARPVQATRGRLIKESR